MHIKHEVILDYNLELGNQFEEILIKLGHGPNFKLYADTPDDTVNGSVTIAVCDTRTFGETIMWSDGHEEIITADNIERYFNDQGHRLGHIVGNQAFGKSTIDVEVYEADEAPNKTHRSTFKRPLDMPSESTLRARLEHL